MKKYRIPFEAKVYGFVVVEAESKQQLLENELYADQGEWIDQHENKEDYEFDLEHIEEKDE